MTNDRLEVFARDFAKKIQHLLNTTICTGINLNSVVRRPGTGIIAHKLQKKQLRSEPLPVRRGKGKPHCYLDLSYTFCWDETQEYPTVQSSFFALVAPDKERTLLCHLDYERDKADGYPEAHVQVHGDSPALNAWPAAQGRPLSKLHFPVGGRRYRPILEDVIEFLAAEKLVPALAPGAEEIIKAGREEFRVIQLRAAIRRDPDTALRALRDFGKIPRDGPP